MSIDAKEVKKSVDLLRNTEQRDFGEDKFNAFLKESEPKDDPFDPLAKSNDEIGWMQQNYQNERLKRDEQILRQREKDIHKMLFETSESFRP